VGEGLLLDDSKHGTSARALQQTDVLVLRSEKVQDMLKEHPQLYAALIGRAARAISQRLAATDATIVGRGRTLGFGGHHVRVENDLLGEREIPDDALYGVQTCAHSRTSRLPASPYASSPLWSKRSPP
jgi:aspartate ammonia-lyase